MKEASLERLDYVIPTIEDSGKGKTTETKKISGRQEEGREGSGAQGLSGE